MSALSWTRTLGAIAFVLMAVAVFRVAGGWVYGESPYEQYLKWVHGDIPPFTVPVRLVEGMPATFPARIIRKHGHELNLMVYFTWQEERILSASLLGGPIVQPINEAMPHGKVPTAFRVIIQDSESTMTIPTTRTDHSALGASFIARHLARLPPLDEGLYTISVTPLNDVSGLAPLRTELELTFRSK
jgi:hypothetical protein